MKQSTFVLMAALIISSCAVFDKYHDNRLTWYHAGLTKAERDSVSTNEYVIKYWYGRNSNGDFSKGPLYVGKTNARNYYEFIETGVWIEKHSASAKRWKATINDSTVYDGLGNILFKETFIDELNDTAGPYLYEKWTSTLNDSLTQTALTFYPNGQLKSKANLTVLDHRYPVRDNMRQKRLTSLETYLENGQKCTPSELTFNEWYEPGTWMK